MSLTETKHPVILPRKSAASDVSSNGVASVAHGARGLTLNHLRNSGIWTISANTAVKGVTQRCVACCKLQGKTSFQKNGGSTS